MPKAINVRVTTLEAELEFAILPATTGKQLFDQTAKTIGLQEVWLFGLDYVDQTGQRAWVNLDKKLLSHDLKPENPVQLRFRIKYFPEDVETELIQTITKRLLFLQIREAILTDEIYCAPDTAVLLASYACQAKHGDRRLASIGPETLSNERLLPPRVIMQFKLSPIQWTIRIIEWWSEHGSMLREDAYIEYLKVAQDLEMYGITYFDIRNKRGTPSLLGVDALGINIYEPSDKLTPKIGFAWTDLNCITCNKKKFIVKSSGPKTSDLVMTTSHERITKRIAALCLGNHQLYFRRRQPDPIEIQQLKEQAREEKKARDLERARLEEEAKKRKAAADHQTQVIKVVEDHYDTPRVVKKRDSSSSSSSSSESDIRAKDTNVRVYQAAGVTAVAVQPVYSDSKKVKNRKGSGTSSSDSDSDLDKRVVKGGAAVAVITTTTRRSDSDLDTKKKKKRQSTKAKRSDSDSDNKKKIGVVAVAVSPKRVDSNLTKQKIETHTRRDFTSSSDSDSDTKRKTKVVAVGVHQVNIEAEKKTPRRSHSSDSDNRKTKVVAVGVRQVNVEAEKKKKKTTKRSDSDSDAKRKMMLVTTTTTTTKTTKNEAKKRSSSSSSSSSSSDDERRRVVDERIDPPKSGNFVSSVAVTTTVIKGADGVKTETKSVETRNAPMALSSSQPQHPQYSDYRHFHDNAITGVVLTEERDVRMSQPFVETTYRPSDVSNAKVEETITKVSRETVMVQNVSQNQSHQREAKQAALRADLMAAKRDSFGDMNEYNEVTLNMAGVVVTQTELDRVPEWQRNAARNAKMMQLNAELQTVRDDNKLVVNDRLHIANQRTGRDKFKTLREIRQGNTKKRIDEFESM